MNENDYIKSNLLGVEIPVKPKNKLPKVSDTKSNLLGVDNKKNSKKKGIKIEPNIGQKMRKAYIRQEKINAMLKSEDASDEMLKQLSGGVISRLTQLIGYAFSKFISIFLKLFGKLVVFAGASMGLFIVVPLIIIFLVILAATVKNEMEQQKKQNAQNMMLTYGYAVSLTTTTEATTTEAPTTASEAATTEEIHKPELPKTNKNIVTEAKKYNRMNINTINQFIFNQTGRKVIMGLKWDTAFVYSIYKTQGQSLNDGVYTNNAKTLKNWAASNGLTTDIKNAVAGDIVIIESGGLIKSYVSAIFLGYNAKTKKATVIQGDVSKSSSLNKHVTSMVKTVMVSSSKISTVIHLKE